MNHATAQHNANHRQMKVEFAIIRIVKGGSRNEDPRFLYIKERGVDFQGKPYSHAMSKKWHDVAEENNITFEKDDCIVTLAVNVPNGAHTKDDYTLEGMCKMSINEGRRLAAIIKADTDDLLAAGKSFFDSPIQIQKAVELGLLSEDTPIPKQTHTSSAETLVAAVPLNVATSEPKEPLLPVKNGMVNVGKMTGDTTRDYWVQAPTAVPAVKIEPVKDENDVLIGYNTYSGVCAPMSVEVTWNEPKFEPL